MKIDDIQAAIQADSNVEMHNLGLESSRIPTLHSKYLTYRTNEKLILRALAINYSKLYRDRWIFYTGKGTPEQYKKEEFGLKVLRTDVDIFLKADEQLLKLQSNIDVQEAKVELLEDFLKALLQRHWMIKNAIDSQKIMNGIL